MLVTSDSGWFTTPNYSEGACWVDALEVFGWEVLGELTYVVLAVLFTIVNTGRRQFIAATSVTYATEEVPDEHDDLPVLCIV